MFFSSKPALPTASITVTDVNEIRVNKDITPEQYLDFVYSLLGIDSLVRASEILEMNGHTRSGQRMATYITDKLTKDTQLLAAKSVPVPVDEYELVKPSKGLF